MQAIILAAGMGKRLKQLTRNNTKCMVKVGGVPLINRTLRQLDSLDLSRIIIVTGYEGQKLRDHIATLDVKTPVCFIDNPIYDKTNNIYSLALASEYLVAEDTLLLESDIIFEDSVLRCLVEDERESLALVAKYESWMDGTCVKLSEHDDIEAMIPGSKFSFRDTSDYYKTVNLYKFSRSFSATHYVPFLEAYTKALGNNEYYEQVLKVIVMLDNPGIKAKRLDDSQKWYEIDDIQDLDIAESLFAEDKDRLPLIQRRYGGYWRYPKMLDFCYLVNCYYPPKKMLEEMKANFDSLVCQYPSGMYVNSLLAGRNFGVRQDQIVPGNGAAELIKLLVEKMDGKMGVIRPTFEEYANRRGKEDVVVMNPADSDFRYGADDIMNFFGNKELKNLVIINPDNPSGNYIPKKDILRLAAWTKERKIRLIVDESFIDFASEETETDGGKISSPAGAGTILDEGILDENPHMTVVKSISKSYGVPGLRLGIAASGDRDLIASLKKEVAIWNINSLAEFYLQIEEKYRKDYAASLKLLQAERSRFAAELETIPGIRVLPSQANYLMAELTGCSSKWLTEQLLNRFNILIKDLSSKIPGDRQFIRIAVRNEEDDTRLTEALREIMART
ncbi:MAG TPA: aminotransferase class I/II-fold pyridoxal phosphate-dependent enzyme [Candidatus Lachnoclostridium avicola]|nr:aminotransferase class I/II-fold pyridoxal phosphate-dependent enzyme [Candidatus Lachnoclostridium avicola]